MNKTHKNKYDPKKDKLNINYDEYKRRKQKEDSKDYINRHDFKFMFYYIPEEITKSFLGFKLTLLVKIVSIYYAFRALKSLHEQISMLNYTQNNFSILNFIFNSVCIFTSIMLYFSMYKKTYSFMCFGYYVYLVHYFIKILETLFYLFEKLSQKRTNINAIIGIILGLSTSSVLNLCSTWIIFSYMVYTYNIKYNENLKMPEI